MACDSAPLTSRIQPKNINRQADKDRDGQSLTTSALVRTRGAGGGLGNGGGGQERKRSREGRGKRKQRGCTSGAALEECEEEMGGGETGQDQGTIPHSTPHDTGAPRNDAAPY